MRRRLAPLAICIVLAGAGCSTLAEADDSGQPATATATAITAERTCADLTVPSSLAFNGPRDFEKGVISDEERDTQLLDAKRRFTEIEAPPGAIEHALAALNAYLAQAPQANDGSPFDAHAFEYANLESNLAQACEAAGAELIIEGHGG